MMNVPKLDRRQAFTGFALTFTALTFGLPGTAAAQAPAWAPVALTPAQARTLSAAAELIIPATDTPGAREAGVPQFVDRTIGGWCEKAQADLLRSGLDSLDADARTAHGAAFADLPVAQQTAILAGYDKPDAPQRAFFFTLRELVTIGYFTSRPGATQALRYAPVPGAYHGCVPLKEIGRAWATS